MSGVRLITSAQTAANASCVQRYAIKIPATVAQRMKNGKMGLDLSASETGDPVACHNSCYGMALRTATTGQIFVTKLQIVWEKEGKHFCFF